MEDFAFSTKSILITNSLNISIFSKKRLCSTVDLFSVVRVLLFSIYKTYKRFFHFSGRFKVLKSQYFKLLCQRHIQNLDLFSVVRVLLFSIYKIYERFFHFSGRFEVLKSQYFKLLCQRHIQNLLKHLR